MEVKVSIALPQEKKGDISNWMSCLYRVNMTLFSSPPPVLKDAIMESRYGQLLQLFHILYLKVTFL